jgi:WD40 repeat protein
MERELCLLAPMTTLCIWDAETGAALREPLEGHTKLVTSVAFSPDGKRIVSGSNDNTVCIWDAETGAALREPLEGHTDRVTSVAFSPDGKRIVSSSLDKTVRIWDVETGAALREPLEGHASWVTSVRFPPNGRSILSDSNECTICPWNVDGVANGPPLQCSPSASGWSLLNVGSSSMHTFSMDSFSIPASSPEIPFCASALANTKWLGLLSPLGTPFLAPYPP